MILEPVTVGILGIILVLVLMFLKVPVAFSMIFVGIFGIMYLNSPSAAIQVVVSDIYTSFNSYTMSVIPLFALMGLLAAYSGLGTQLFMLADKFFGHIAGGLCVATQLACGIFGAICGSMPATIATLGTVAYPEMKKLGYDDSLSTAAIASGSCLSVMIPPSVTFIIYGIATETSIGDLFISGVIPGIIEMILFMLVGYFLVKSNPKLAPLKEKAKWADRFKALTKGGVIEIIIIFALSMGGIFIGWFTATEAGAVGAGGMLLIGIVKRKISWKSLMAGLGSATKLTAMVFIIVAGANIFGRFFAFTRIPVVLGGVITSLDIPGWAICGVIILIYAFMGMIMDTLAMILLTIPIFFPIVCTTLGYDPVWFGCVIVLAMSMGSLTPPIGLNVFVMNGTVPSVPLYTIFKGVWPYVGAILATAAIIIIFPVLCTWLPSVA
jgi:tripartite ATP-independent transporter DctM subunit